MKGERLLSRILRPGARTDGAFRPGEWAERGEITLEAAANIIGVIPMTALRMIKRGNLKGRQLCRGAPWVIKAEDVATFVGARPDRPLTANPAQQPFDFQ
jgi:hypothetical protein